MVSPNASGLKSGFIVWLIFSLRLDSIEAQKTRLTMLFFIPTNTKNSVANRTAPVIVVAIDALKRHDVLKDFDVQWRLRDSKCLGSLAAKEFYAMWLSGNETAHVLIGGYCESVCRLLTAVSAALNVPFIAVGCRTSRVRNHRLFPTYLSVEPSRYFTIPGIIGIMEYFGWTVLGILATPDEAMVQLSEEIKEALNERGWTATVMLTAISVETGSAYSSQESNEEAELILTEITKGARIIFLSMGNVPAARILLMAQKQGMYNGEYAFIGYNLNSVDAQSIGAKESEWRVAKVGLVALVPDKHYANLESHHFIDLINVHGKSEEKFEPIKIKQLSSQDGENVNSAGQLYEAILLYSYLLNNTIMEMQTSGNISSMEEVLGNGTHLLAHPNNVSTEGKLVVMDFDPVGRSISYWVIVNSGRFGSEIQIGSVRDKNVSVIAKSMTWPGDHTEKPLDQPECGWDGEKCSIRTGSDSFILILVCAVIGVLFATSCFVAIMIAWQTKIESDKKLLDEWQVKWPEIIILGDNVIGRISDRVTGGTRGSIGGTRGSIGGTSRSEAPGSQRFSTSRIYTLMGSYKGKTVAIKKISRDSVDIFQPVFYDELKQLLSISHQNVNPFMGVCAEAPNVCVLMLYADRGSLQDVLAETKYDINWEFKICLATDVARGMEYLHESTFGPHGHLTSANCVVNRKWECKITDYGLKQFKKPKDQAVSSFRWNSDLLWCAPEILKKTETHRCRVYGTKDGDVYSFGIIVYELITKEMPYSTQLESMSPADLVVMLKTDVQFRPVLPPSEDFVGANFNSLATVCWHQNPDVRPSFKSIRTKLKFISGGKVPNLMNRIQGMLEDALQRKATDIAAEKKRTELVIYNLLPTSVADKIMEGVEVRPQKIASVTLCFCETRDIFLTSKPLSAVQMTEILNSLFLMYDTIMKRHNVSETYCNGSRVSLILGSGFPQYNEGHAESVCDLCLDLISEATTFKTPLAPDLNLNLKISVHSGPVITAVIWQILPRYSVTGEAVQTITAMQRASKAMRARISETTYDLIRKTGTYTIEQGGKVLLWDDTTMRTYWLTGKADYRLPLPSSFKRRSSSIKTETLDFKRAEPVS